jgi:hypothetical protein
VFTFDVFFVCVFANTVFAQNWQETYDKADSLMTQKEILKT